VTDGQVHDTPEAPTDFGAPLHALIVGDENERDRRIRFERAPRFAIVGRELEMTYRVIGSPGETDTVDVRISVNGEQRVIRQAIIGEEMPFETTITTAGRNIVE